MVDLQSTSSDDRWRRYSPEISQDCGSFGNEISIIIVILGVCMRSSSQNSNRSPSERLFHDSSDVWQILFISPGWASVPSNHTIQLLLCLLDKVFAVDSAGKNKCRHCRGRSITPSTKETTGERSNFLVCEVMFLTLIPKLFCKTIGQSAVVVASFRPHSQCKEEFSCQSDWVGE